MGHALVGNPPVQRSREDDLVSAAAVTMMEIALIETGHSAQPDMRMRAHVDTLAGQELCRASLIEESKWAYHLTLGRRKCALALEPAKIAGARDNQGLDRIDSDLVRASGGKGRVPTQSNPPSLSTTIAGASNLAKT